MPLRQVRYKRIEHEFEIAGAGRLAYDTQLESFVIPEEVADEVSVASLAAAFRQHGFAEPVWGRTFRPDRIYISPQTHLELEDELYVQTRDVWLDVTPEGVTAVAELEVMDSFDDKAVESVLRAVAARPRVALGTIVRRANDNTIAELWPPGDEILSVSFRGRRGASVADVAAAADDALRLLHAIRDQATGLDFARHLLLGGRPDLLIGHAEDASLDAKRVPYNLDDSLEQLELAKDVAAFANSGGGLVALGLATRSTSDGDVLTKIHPFPLGSFKVQRYSALIGRKIYPPPERVRVHRVPLTAAGEGIVVIEIPEQPESLKPFLVHGVAVAGRVLGSYLALFERRSDETRSSSAAELHSLIHAGRALFRSSD